MKRKAFSLILVLLLLVGMPAGLFHHTLHREQAGRDLIAAIKRNDIPASIIALKDEADPNVLDHSEDKPSSFGEELQRLLDRLLHPWRKPPPDTRPTALLLLCQSVNRIEWQGEEPSSLIKALLDAGADPNVSDTNGRSPLILMANWQNEPSFTFLLAHGANVTHQDSGGKTALHAVALWNGSAEMAEKLLIKGADIEARDKEGKTPLHIACYRDQGFEVAKVLLLHHANVNSQDNDGETPLYIACCGFADRGVPMLLAAGADGTIKDQYGSAPLHMAAGKHGERFIVQALLRSHADLNVRDSDGETPLHYAIDNYNEETALALLAAGADPNLKDKRGMTPLHHACEEEYTTMAELLIRHHAAVNDRDNKGRTPLDCTAEASIRRPLKQAGGKRAEQLHPQRKKQASRTKETSI